MSRVTPSTIIEFYREGLWSDGVADRIILSQSQILRKLYNQKAKNENYVEWDTQTTLHTSERVVQRSSWVFGCYHDSMGMDGKLWRVYQDAESCVEKGKRHT